MLPRDEADHLGRVLRLGAGDTVAVFDGRGHEFLARVAGRFGRDVRLRVLSRIEPAAEPVAALLRSARLDRWRRVALASVKQSRRAVVPEIRTPLTLDTFLGEPPAALRLMLVEPGASIASEPLSAL